MNWGMLLALLGAGLAVTMNCIGSSRGVGMVAEASSPVIAEDSSKFGKLLILMLLPGSQGLYGLVIAIITLTQIGILGGDPVTTISRGFFFLLACLPMAVGGLVSALLQARVALTGVNLISKRPQDSSKALTSASLVELYALLSFVTSLLIVIGVNNLPA
ncbi:MAG: V-type ATP synthase subunit K [Clostridiales bacterium]|nr:V-type ATP synthase subunit K [Clostridiales bacterium]